MASHDPVTPHNFEVQVDGPEGQFVRATVRLHQTVPVGGIELSVLWDPVGGRVVEVRPWRNLGCFVTEALARAAGGSAGH